MDSTSLQAVNLEDLCKDKYRSVLGFSPEYAQFFA